MKEKYYLQTDIVEITENLKKYLKYFSGKKFLISGANGFLGKYFIKTLVTLNKKLKKKQLLLQSILSLTNVKFIQIKMLKKSNAT